MGKHIFIIFGILFFQFGFSQKSIDKITISFENLTIVETLLKIESESNIRFYYVENWFDPNQKISGEHNDESLSIILHEIFEDTLINFYVTEDGKVILTQNSVIYDTLPLSFFGEREKEKYVIESSNPVLITNEISTESNKVETIRIGKEIKNSSFKEYTLTGSVTNLSTGEKIPYLVLTVPDKDINTVTDQNGNYSIDLPVGTNYLELKSLGMSDSRKKIIIYNNGVYNFEMIESLEMLDEIIIESDIDRNVEETISGITKIQINEIKTVPLVLGERDILKIATTLPGISRAGEGATGYNVRGGKADQNLMLLDNGVLYNPTHFFGIFSAFNPYTTGGLEIYKGNIPAQYGGRLSSVFDITTKTGDKESIKGEGGIGPVTANLMLELPIVKEKASLIVGGRATYSDWLLKAINNENLNNSQASFYDAILKYSHEFNDKNTLNVTGYYSNDKFSISSDSLYTYRNALISLKWDHRFSEKSLGSLILAHSSYDYDIGFEGVSNGNFDFKYKIQETEVKLIFNYILNTNHTFNYGVSSKLYNNFPGEKSPNGAGSIVEPINISEENALESAVFISDNFNINKKLSFSAGLRYSFYAFLGETEQRVYADGQPKNVDSAIDTLRFDTNEVAKKYGGPEFRFSTRYSFTPSFSIKASYSNVYQFVHTLSNNTTASPTDTWKLSDYNIKPQTSNQISLGLFKNLEGNNYEISVEAYYKQSKNLLDYKVGAQLLLNDKIETEVLQGDGKSYGIEILVKKNSGRLNGWIGYTYSKSLIKLDSEFSEERVNDGDYFPTNYDKPHDFGLVANYKLTKRFSFSTNFIYQTGRPVTYPIGKYISNGSEYVFYSDRNQFRIPDYYRLDLGVNIEGNHKVKKLAHSFWNISVYNVLGRNNPYSVFFVTDNGEIKAYKSSIFSTAIPTITYNFKF